jgi:DNA-directed RNA polymerase specialized sigma24 family protein
MRGREGAGMVAADLLSPPRAGDGEAFREPSGPYRRELQVHRYRMLGSFQDAEDAARETMLAAWQDIGGFAEERASLRTWLYKIATSRCLNARRAASASEVAGMLEVTLESANSALKRARASLPAPAAPGGAPPAAARRWLTCRGRDRGQVRPPM